MIDPKENSEFCFLETLDVPRGRRRVLGKLFPLGLIIKCLLISPPH